MNDLFQESKKILILFQDTYDIDIYASVVSLTKVLQIMKKDVSISTEHKFPGKFRDLFSLTAPNMVEDLSKRRLILNMKKGQGKIKDVSWTENDTEVTFVIAPSDEKFHVSNVSFQFLGTTFDTVVTLGVQRLEDLKQYKQYKDTIDNMKIINIDNLVLNKDYGTTNFVKPNASAISETVYELLKESELKFPKDVGTILLSGMLWKTEGLRYGLKNSRTFKNIASLLGLGANYNQAVRTALGNLNIQELSIFSQIIENTKIFSHGKLAGSVIPKKKLSTPISELMSPELNFVSRLKDVDASFVILEQEGDSITVIITSNNKNLNLLTKLNEFSPLGDIRKVHFNSSLSSKDMTERLVHLLGGVIEADEEAEATETSTKVETKQQPEVSDAEDTKINGDKEHEKAVEPEEIKAIDAEDSESQNIGQENIENEEDPLKKATSIPEPQILPPTSGMGFGSPMGADPLPKATKSGGRK